MVGSVTLELVFPASHSLKDKRRALKGRMERIRRTYGVSVAEISENDSFRNARIEAALVSNERSVLHRVLTKVIDEFDTGDEIIVTGSQLDI